MLGFSVLTPEYAASKIVDAIEKNQIRLIMPRGAYFSAALQQYVLQFDIYTYTEVSHKTLCLSTEFTVANLSTQLINPKFCVSVPH